MQIFTDKNWSELVISPSSFQNWALTIGNFDGVHLGHQFLIEKLKKFAKKEKINSGILTFSTHPKKILTNQEIFEIYGLKQKTQLLKENQPHSIFFLRFHQKMAKTSATDFITALKEKISIKYFFVGYDFFFGKNREGNIDLLKKIVGEKKVIQVAPLKKEKILSSSMIRQTLLKGDFKSASFFLGKEWSIKEKVIQGKKLGRKIGFPTINLELDFLPPIKKGVYIVEVEIKKKRKKGIANYGFAPSIEEQQRKKAILECHLFQFNENIYGEEVKVIMKKFLREEKKFQNLALLKQQIKLDTKNALDYFE